MIIGVTGQSGTGKTYVCKMLSQKIGYTVIDADKIVDELYDNKTEYYNNVVKCFGDKILNENKTINREKLADLIFNNPQEKAKLNEITFKYVVKEIKDRITSNVIIDAPLLFESKLNEICDFNVAILADKEIKVDRICKRDNISKDKAIERLKAQNDDKYYKERADFIIYNNEENEIEYQIEEIMVAIK